MAGLVREVDFREWGNVPKLEDHVGMPGGDEGMGGVMGMTRVVVVAKMDGRVHRKPIRITGMMMRAIKATTMKMMRKKIVKLPDQKKAVPTPKGWTTMKRRTLSLQGHLWVLWPKIVV